MEVNDSFFSKFLNSNRGNCDKKSGGEKQLASKETKNDKNDDTTVINNQPENIKVSSQNQKLTDKIGLIIQLKEEITKLRKNFDPNNAEQKSLLASKEAELAKLESRQGKNFEESSDDKNKGLSLPTKIAVGSGVILILTALLVGIMRKRKKTIRVK